MFRPSVGLRRNRRSRPKYAGGDHRLRKRFGAAFEEWRDSTSVLPFQAVWDGRQQLQPGEFVKPSQVGIAVAVGVIWWAHRWIGSAATAFSRTALAHWLG